MNDVLGHKIHIGDTVVVARASSYSGNLGIAIVLDLLPVKKDKYKTTPDMIKIISTRSWHEKILATRPGNTFPTRVCVVDNVSTEMLEKLTEAYNVYWDSKRA